MQERTAAAHLRGMTKDDSMGLRPLTTTELDALALRVGKTWTALQTNGAPEHLRLPALLQGFGDWRRVSAPIHESYGRLAFVMFRNSVSDEYALLSAPDTSDEPIREADMSALLAAGRDAVVGDFMQVWQWALSTQPALTQVAVQFANRLPLMSEDIRFLCAFTLVEDTFREAAADARPRLIPLPSITRAAVDLRFWEATDAARQNITEWVHEEVERFVGTVSNQEVATNEDSVRIEAEHLVEVFIDEQFDFDPLGVDRVPFEWSVQGLSA